MNLYRFFTALFFSVFPTIFTLAQWSAPKCIATAEASSFFDQISLSIIDDAYVILLSKSERMSSTNPPIVKSSSVFLCDDSQSKLSLSAFKREKVGKIYLQKDLGATLHAVWSSVPDCTDLGVQMTVESKNLAYSTFYRGIWEAPKIIFEANDDRVPQKLLSILDGNGVQHLVFTVNLKPLMRKSDSIPVNFEEGIRYMRRHGTEWKKFQPITPNGGLYPHMAVSKDGKIYIAYISAFTDIQRGDFDKNSVFLAISEDSGRTWKQRLASRSRDKLAYNPHIFSEPSGKLHLLWEKQLRNSGLRGSAVPANGLWHIQSSDANIWSEPVSVVPDLVDSVVFNTKLVMDYKGRIHLVGNTANFLGNRMISLFYASYTDGKWSAPNVIARGSISKPEIACDRFGNVHVVWLELTPLGHKAFYTINSLP